VSLTSPPGPLIRGHHWTISRPPGASNRWIGPEKVQTKRVLTNVIQFLGFQVTWWPCPNYVRGSE
jgi:hypothetical protein